MSDEIGYILITVLTVFAIFFVLYSIDREQRKKK